MHYSHGFYRMSFYEISLNYFAITRLFSRIEVPVPDLGRKQFRWSGFFYHNDKDSSIAVMDYKFGMVWFEAIGPELMPLDMVILSNLLDFYNSKYLLW